MKSKLLFTLLLTVFLPHASAAAEEKPPAAAEAHVNRARITIGDPFEFTLLVRRNPDILLLAPITVPVNRDFEVRKAENIQRKEDGQIVEGRKLTLSAYRLGEFVLDSVTIPAKWPDGTVKNLTTPKLYITVVSVQKGPPASDIRGIKGVIDIPLRFLRRYGLWIAFTAILAAAAWLIWRRFRKPGALTPEVRTVLSPEHQAFQDLHTLFDSALLRQGRYRDYFFRMSEIMRGYFEKRYLIFAVEATTSEVLRLLRDKDVNPELLAEIQELLEMSDLAKFAKWKPDAGEITRLNQKAEIIIRKAAALPAAPV